MHLDSQSEFGWIGCHMNTMDIIYIRGSLHDRCIGH